MAPSAGGDFSVPRFMGVWHIVHSSLRMWRAGDKADPRLVYAPLQPAADGAERWSDEVLYVTPAAGASSSSGKTHSIKGTDTMLPQPAAHGAEQRQRPRFRWRGAGLLCWVTCDCEILAWDAEYSWCVIGFAKTLFTEAGLDVCSRSPGPLPDEQLRAILAQVSLDASVARLLADCGGVHATKTTSQAGT